MRILIVEDDNNIIRILEQIIVDQDMGDVVGKLNDGSNILESIRILKPDIVLVDLLMPVKDGITILKEAVEVFPNLHFVMISQVSSKDMIAKAYESGVEYYISKPINAVELRVVLNKIREKIQMKEKLEQIQRVFHDGKENPSQKTNLSDKRDAALRVMQKIGIMGEAGSKDILDIVTYLIDNDKIMSDYTVSEICKKFDENPRTMEQRIRRTATTGLVNLANLGIEDYMNDVFMEYSNGLYNFEQLKIEMDHIRGKGKSRGKVNLKKFIDGLVYAGKL